MCQSYTGDRTLLPITAKGLDAAIAAYSSRSTPGAPIPAALVREAYAAMTDKCFPRIIHFTALMDLVHRAYAGERSMWGAGPAILFSARAEGSLTRYRSPEMTALHESWTAFHMSGRNERLLVAALRRNGLALVPLCCCGFILVDPDEEKAVLERSGDFNQARTLADAFGRVEEHVALEDIPAAAMDAGMREAYMRIRAAAVRIAEAQDDCRCHTIRSVLERSGIDADEIGRATAVRLHVPAGYRTSRHDKTPAAAVTA